MDVSIVNLYLGESQDCFALAYLLPKSNGHALRVVGPGHLEFFQMFTHPGVAIPPNALIGYTALVVDQDGRGSRRDIIGKRNG